MDRFLTVENTAEAHAALARWCQANGLPDKARVHWQETIFRDADHREARTALGFVRRNMEWVQASSAAPAPAAARAGVAEDPTLGRRRAEFTQQVQDTVRTLLGSMDPATQDQGRRRLLMIRDPAAVEPVGRILGAGDDEHRILACEILGQIPGDEAGRRLVKFVLADPSRPVYEAAVKALALRTDGRGLEMLLNALSGSEEVLKRAAYALGEMREWRAADALVARLKTQEPRVRTYDAPRDTSLSGNSGAYFFSGTVVTYVKDVEPVVAEGAVGWDPTIGTIPVGAMVSVQNPRVTIHRTIIEFVRQPVVREALQKITGQDFEFNSEAWRDYLRRRESDR
jgi:hypothetical protein